MELGYKILKIYEVLDYSETTVYDKSTHNGGLFVGYMDTFMRVKMESSDFPSDCVTEEDKMAYVNRVEQHEGIKLDINQIKYNSGRRQVAKLCLNNLWGKLAQRPNLPKKEFIRDPVQYFNIMGDDGYDMSDVMPINDDAVYISYKKGSDFEQPSKDTNVIIACYVTAHARLELYSYLEKLRDRVIYCDTDSVIYTSKPGMYEPQLGEFVGDMTDELNGGYITEFVSNGPKNYGYKTSDGNRVVKVKGFTLNHHTSKTITFDTMKDLALSTENKVLKVTDGHKIVKDLKNMKINTVAYTKSYRKVFDKRVLQNDNTSLPYGF